MPYSLTVMSTSFHLQIFIANREKKKSLNQHKGKGYIISACSHFI